MEPGVSASPFGRRIADRFFFNDTATTEIYTLSLHDALPIYCGKPLTQAAAAKAAVAAAAAGAGVARTSVLSPPPSAAEAHACPVCGSTLDPSQLGRFTPDRRSDQRLTLVLLEEAGVELRRFE